MITQKLLHCPDCNSQRKGVICQKCGTETIEVANGWSYPELPDIEKIRILAKEVGYALAVHGTLERDVDLIAVPWVDTAIGNKELCEYIATGMNARIIAIERKPLGRYAASIQIDGWFKLIDLSVTPKG